MYHNHVIPEIITKFCIDDVIQISGVIRISLHFSNLQKNGRKTGDFLNGSVVLFLYLQNSFMAVKSGEPVLLRKNRNASQELVFVLCRFDQ